MTRRDDTSHEALTPALSSAGAFLPGAPAIKAGRPRRRGLLILGLVALLFVLLAIFTFYRLNQTIHVGPRTTFVTGPLRSDGTVNYVHAYNLLFSKGVTPQNNSAIPLIRIFGANAVVLGRSWRSALKAIGYTRAQAVSPKFESLPHYLRLHPSAKKAMQANPILQYQFLSGHMLTHVWTAREFPVFAAYFHDQTTVFAALRRAAKRPRFYIPAAKHTPLMVGGKATWLGLLDAAAKELVARAMFDAGRRKFSDVMPDLQAAQRIAQLIGQRPGLIPWLMADGLMQVVSRAQCALATDPRIQMPRQFFVGILARRFHRKLPSLAWELNYPERIAMLQTITGLYRALRGERNSVSGTPSQASALSALVDWNWILRSTNRQFDYAAKASRESPMTRRFAACAALRRQETLKYKGSFLSDVQPSVLFRNLFCRIFGTHGIQLTFFRCCMIQQRRYARVAAALALARIDSGHFPDTLARLSPKYLQHEPRDVFTGGPLKYRRTKTGYVLTCDWQIMHLHFNKYSIANLTVRYPCKPGKPLKKN